MQVFFKVFIFLSILNSIITKTVKDVMENNNTEVNKGKETTQSRADLSLILNITVTLKSLGKWHVGRVSRKQYEIINMLWRKTKIFIDTESTKSLNNSLNVVKHKRDKNAQHVTLVNHNPIQESFQLAHPKSKVYSSTPSYIEFYYLDELDERIKHKENTVKNTNNIIISEIFGRTLKAGMSRSPFFLFRVNEATCKATTNSFSHHSVKFTTMKPITHDNIKKTRRTKTNKKDKIHASTHFYRDSITKSKINNSLTVSLPTSKFKKTELKQQTYETSEKGFLDIMNKYASAAETTSAVNDHIRFFDIYDSDINTPYNNIEDDEDKIVNNNILQNEEKINLNQVDYSAKLDDKNKTRYVKKHINQNKDHLKRNYEFYNLATTISDNLSNPTKTLRNRSRLTHWSEFPFVAVYVYEPTQVRCDSASISPHWLVASATCLNRHHKDIKAEGRSAFVAYCSGNWRHPGRISYVKQSLIHPRFHPKDNSRRQLYNIGAIKVVNSMADTCNGWAPITLMTHQFTAASDGTLSTALGWGLDRYDARYSLTELPKYLTLYEGIIHSDSCPGNTGYSKAKSLDAKSIKNVYCLSLPPYAEEEKDAIHGSILLIGGKLIALYMQEERRRRGNQSAQYTGIWHLIPWLLDVAREPDELDPFSLEI